MHMHERQISSTHPHKEKIALPPTYTPWIHPLPHSLNAPTLWIHPLTHSLWIHTLSVNSRTHSPTLWIHPSRSLSPPSAANPPRARSVGRRRCFPRKYYRSVSRVNIKGVSRVLRDTNALVVIGIISCCRPQICVWIFGSIFYID